MARTSGRQAAAKASEAIRKTSEGGHSNGATKRKTTASGKAGSPQQAKKGRKGGKDDSDGKKFEPVKEDREGESEKEEEGSPKEEKKEESPKKESPKEESPKEESPKEDKEESKSAQPTGDAQSPSKLKSEAEKTWHTTTDSPPSNVLEKGIIYFFFRGRVNTDDPTSMSDVARSFLVLRPLPLDSTLAGGVLNDEKAAKCRLILLPKKVLPQHPKQRYMCFIEKAGADVGTIRESFAGEDHETKTRGVTHTPAATPYAEGVYAITRSERASHLAYVLTIPQEVTEVQEDFGVAERGSFIVAVKNPKYPGPRGARIPEGPKFPEEILEEMRDLRWVPVRPEYLEYANAQLVLIGEHKGAFGSAGETDEGKQEKGTEEETAAEEVDRLEHMDEIRTEPLPGSEAVFRDLGVRGEEVKGVRSTWGEE